MDTLQLECFVQVADNLNFRRAAQEMHLSQPTVSKYVASLESELGGALFSRSTRSVALTELGTAFLADAREMLRIAYASQRRARSIVTGSSLTIAYSDPNELKFLSKVLAKMRAERKDFKPSLHLGSRDANLQLLERGQVDVVMGFETKSVETGGLVFEELLDDPLSCVVRKGTRLAKLDFVGPEDVKGMPQVVCLPASLRRRGYGAQGSIPSTPEEVTTWCSTTSEALCLVDAGYGYALIPSILAEGSSGKRNAIPWTGSPRAAYGAYVLDSRRSDAVRAFIQTAKIGA